MKILIVTGGTMCRHAGKIIRDFQPDHIICADAGIQYAFHLGLRIDQILGDFDSVDPDVLEKVRKRHLPEQVFPSEKDDTDTELALHTALALPGDHKEILLIGALGSRADHSLANIMLLKQTADARIPCRIVDDNNVIEMIRGPQSLAITKYSLPEHDEDQEYISLLPVFGDALNVTLKGLYYPLEHGTISAGISLGISNELKEEQGTVTLQEGYLLVMHTYD